MKESIKINCSYCGKVLTVPNVPDINNKTVVCPGCKQRSRIADCHRVVEAPAHEYEDSHTMYPGMVAKGASQPQPQPSGPKPAEDGSTRISVTPAPKPIGQLYCPNTGQRWILRTGNNVIGRDCSSTSANIRINTGADKKRTSREHITIEVHNSHNGDYKYMVRLYKSEVNDTYVNNVKLIYGDCLLLKEGDIIHLPDGFDIRLVIPDSDRTAM